MKGEGKQRIYLFTCHPYICCLPVVIGYCFAFEYIYRCFFADTGAVIVNLCIQEKAADNRGFMRQRLRNHRQKVRTLLSQGA